MTTALPLPVRRRPPDPADLTQPEADHVASTLPPLVRERRPGAFESTRPGGTLGLVLDALKSGLSVDQTARRLAIPVDAVRAMADHANRTGHLTIINQSCAGTCRAASSAICRTCPLAR